MKDFKNIESIFDSYIPCRSKSHFPSMFRCPAALLTVNSPTLVCLSLPHAPKGNCN